MSQTIEHIGGFSEKERDRRWQKMREFMQERELDALLVMGSGTGESADRYLSNWASGTVIFPLKGEPVLLTAGLGDMLAIKPDVPKENLPWIKDARTGARGAMIAAALKEKGLEKSRVGVVGIGPIGTSWEGWTPYGTWNRVVKRLPDCNFEDVAQAYGESILVHSEEELAHVRYAAQILEQASTEMLKVMRPGANEHELWSAIMKVGIDNRTQLRLPQLVSGPNTVGFRSLWLTDAGEPRVLQAGDVVITELAAHSRGYQAQVQMCAALSPVSSADAECARLARESYEAGVRALRPGNTFEEVVAAMDAPMDRPDVWYITPPLHNMNPMICIGRTGVNIERMPGVEKFPQVGTGRIRGGEIVLEPGMVFELEPNACIGLNRVLIGGTVLVTENEPEELNDVACQMRVV